MSKNAFIVQNSQHGHNDVMTIMNIRMNGSVKVILFFLFGGMVVSNLAAQTFNSVLGYSGAILTPTAYILKDGQLTGHVARIPKLYAENYSKLDYERTVLVSSLGFMPFMEASFGFVRPDNMQGGVGDRTVALRFKLLNEGRYVPAVSAGFHDFFAFEPLHLEPVSAQHFTAMYIVGSKTVRFVAPESFLVFTLGYGPDWLPADDKHLHGLFGSLQYAPIRQVMLLLEHDAMNVNAGIRFDIFSHVTYTMSFWQVRYVMHHLSFSINLK